MNIISIKKTTHCWHRCCQYRYMYAPKCYYWCNHTISITQHYPLSKRCHVTNGVIMMLLFYVVVISSLIFCAATATFSGLWNGQKTRRWKSAPQQYVLFRRSWKGCHWRNWNSKTCTAVSTCTLFSNPVNMKMTLRVKIASWSPVNEIQFIIYLS